MARLIYNDSVVLNTQNLSLSIDPNLGFINSTYSASMSSYAPTVASYSTSIAITSQNNYILINSNNTVILPASPVTGTTYTFRNTSASIPVLSATGSHLIRNVGVSTGTASIQLAANGTYTFTFYNNVWYGI